jgi:hypothetical protein
MDVQITLSRQINVHGEETHELTLREPVGEDVSICGFPYEIRPQADGESAAIKPLADVILKYAARLANVPPSSIKQLAMADVSALTACVMGFFGQSE